MKHLFVPYEIALQLKEKGFDEPCFAYYDDEQKHHPAPYSYEGTQYPANSDLIMNWVAAPLYQQVITWLRKKHFINITLGYECTSNEVEDTYATINFMISAFLKPDLIINGDHQYPTDEEILDKTIIEALKLI